MKKNVLNKILFFAFFSLVVSSCSPSYNSVKRMQKMEEGVSNPTSKEEIEAAIKKYEKRAMDLVLTESQEGIWYKMLGTRYLDQAMYGKAYEAFQKAAYFHPGNSNIYYYIGLCAGFLANSELDYDAKGGLSAVTKRMNYLKLAESAYQTAIKLDSKNYKAMYGIGVLYVFELNEAEKAIPYMEKFLDTQKRDTDAMFILARAYYQTYQFDKAIVLYDKIISINPNAQKTEEAKANKKILLDAQYNR